MSYLTDRLDELSKAEYARMCLHAWVIDETDDNENRTRTQEHCALCKDVRYGCRAKRLEDRSAYVEGYTGSLEAWGPIGVWQYSK